MLPITARFPPSWRTTVTVKRGGGVDRKGIPLPTTEHTVPDCLVSQQGSEEQVRNDDPSTTCWLYAPPGADFESTDRVVIPDGPLWPSGEFELTGKPSKFPLGMSVPLREV